MTPEEILKELKGITEDRYEVWQFPLRLGKDDAIAAELIEIALQRLGEDAKGYELLGVSSTMFWWCMTHLSLGEPDGHYFEKKSSLKRDEPSTQLSDVEELLDKHAVDTVSGDSVVDRVKFALELLDERTDELVEITAKVSGVGRCIKGTGIEL